MAVIKITKENFDEKVTNSVVPVLLDFWAEWCGPCRMLGPELEELEAKLGDKLNIGKVNVDEEPELCVKFQVSSIPLLVFYKNSEIQAQAVGYKSESKIEEMIKL